VRAFAGDPATGPTALRFDHRRRPYGSCRPCRDAPAACQAFRSKSRSSSDKASAIRRPERHSTAINVRLRIPVDARVEHARISVTTSDSVRTSGGRRRPDDVDVDEDRVDEMLAGADSATAICAGVTFFSTT